MICVWVRARIWLLQSPYLKLIGPAVAEIFRIQDSVGKNSQAESELKWGSACIFRVKWCQLSLTVPPLLLIFDRKAVKGSYGHRLFLCKFCGNLCVVCLKFELKSTKFWVRDKIQPNFVELEPNSAACGQNFILDSGKILPKKPRFKLHNKHGRMYHCSLSRLYH